MLRQINLVACRIIGSEPIENKCKGPDFLIYVEKPPGFDESYSHTATFDSKQKGSLRRPSHAQGNVADRHEQGPVNSSVLDGCRWVGLAA